MAVKNQEKNKEKQKRPMKTITLIRKTTACLQSHLRVKCALIGAVCGLGLLSTTAFAQSTTFLNIDAHNSGNASASPAGFIKCSATGTGGANYTFANVGGTGLTLTATNIGTYG